MPTYISCSSKTTNYSSWYRIFKEPMLKTLLDRWDLIPNSVHITSILSNSNYRISCPLQWVALSLPEESSITRRILGPRQTSSQIHHWCKSSTFAWLMLKCTMICPRFSKWEASAVTNSFLGIKRKLSMKILPHLSWPKMKVLSATIQHKTNWINLFSKNLQILLPQYHKMNSRSLLLTCNKGWVRYLVALNNKSYQRSSSMLSPCKAVTPWALIKRWVKIFNTTLKYLLLAQKVIMMTLLKMPHTS